MSRRGSRASAALTGTLVVVGIVVWVAGRTLDIVGPFGVVVALILIVSIPLLVGQSRKNRRLAYLRSRYADEQTVQRIFARNFWNGQSEEQLRDSLGAPLDIESKVLVTRRREIWKYQRTGKNRYRLRITLDNGSVAGWDQK